MNMTKYLAHVWLLLDMLLGKGQLNLRSFLPLLVAWVNIMNHLFNLSQQDSIIL